MTSPPENPVPAVLAAYQAAVLAKDVDAFVALYAEDVRVFDMWGTWEYRGLAAWRAMAADWFGSLGDERVVVDFAEVQVELSPGLASGHAFARYAAVDAAGTELRALNNRISIVLRHEAGAWKIVHEHSSAPIAFDTTKAIFKR